MQSILYLVEKGIDLDVADSLDTVYLEGFVKIFRKREKEFIMMLANACMGAKI